MDSKEFKRQQKERLFGRKEVQIDFEEPKKCEVCNGEQFYETLLNGLQVCACCLGTGYDLSDKDSILEYQAIMLRKARYLYGEKMKVLNAQDRELREFKERYAAQEQARAMKEWK